MRWVEHDTALTNLAGRVDHPFSGGEGEQNPLRIWTDCTGCIGRRNHGPVQSKASRDRSEKKSKLEHRSGQHVTREFRVVAAHVRSNARL